ncbi:hypothetical protein [Hymenobacter terricola]|uniref:hypothetical protein n=1 Tax=Hymenobacter terricola TaxID=2819236 RepID=UPI001B317F86|nr:hypothetical protein [Hymenobacter terricola]
MKYFFLVLWLWLPRAVLALAPLEPLQIARQFVAPTAWPEMKSYLCCEVASQARRQSLGQQIPARLRRVCQLLHQGPATAVVAVELRDSVSRNDFYLHFSKEADGWKLQAVRSLAMTKLSAPMLELLTAMPPAEVAQYDLKHPAADHAFTVGNLRLWAAADADIAAHFARNRADFQEALRLVRAGGYFAAPADTSRAGERAANASPTIQKLLQRLFISRVGQRDTGCATCIEFLIGGRMNSTVGLFYEPNAAAVPAMDPRRIIAIKPLGDGWYLYKTS